MLKTRRTAQRWVTTTVDSRDLVVATMTVAVAKVAIIEEDVADAVT